MIHRLAWLAWLAVLLAPVAAEAQTVHLERFRGPGAAVSQRRLAHAIEAAGGTVTASRDGAAFTLSVRTRRQGHGFRASVELRTADGSRIAARGLRARTSGVLLRRVERWTREVLASHADAPTPAVAAPPVAAPPVTAERAPYAAPVRVSEPPREGPPPFAFELGAGVAGRELTWVDDRFGAVPDYALPAAPLVEAAIEWWPGGHADLGALSGLSLRVDGRMMLGVATETADGVAHPTDAGSVGVGLRYRFPVEVVVPRLEVGYRYSLFTVGEAEGQRPDVPTTEYHLLRAGAGVRWDVGLGVFFDVSAAYLHPVDAGEITSAAWLPRATVGGLDLDGGVGVTIGEVWIAGRFTLRRFFYDARPEPGDPVIVGGVLDQRLGGVLQVGWAPAGWGGW